MRMLFRVTPTMEIALVQDFSEYNISNPGSVYSRVHAVCNCDVMNIAAKAIVCNNRFHNSRCLDASGGSTQRQLPRQLPVATGAGSSAEGYTAEAHEARMNASFERMKASLLGQPDSQWEAAMDSMVATESRVGVLTACRNMLRGLHAPAPLPEKACQCCT